MSGPFHTCVQALEKGIDLLLPDEKVRHELRLGQLKNTQDIELSH